MSFFSFSALKIFGVGLVSMILLDFLRLTFLMWPLFQKNMGNLMRTDVLIIPALLTWVVMTIGLMVFVQANPAYSDTRIHALGYGMLLGGCIYAVYDLTNYATLKWRSWQVMLMDIAWWCVLSGIVSVIMWWLK